MLGVLGEEGSFLHSTGWFKNTEDSNLRNKDYRQYYTAVRVRDGRKESTAAAQDASQERGRLF